MTLAELPKKTALATRMWLAKAAALPQAIMGPLICYFDRPEVIWYSGGPRSISVPFVRLRRKFTVQTAVGIGITG